jgi:branched-chain amino acid aminotransferase
MSLLWVNGTLIEKADSRVSPFDHGFLYGDGVWEPLRAAHGRLVLVEEHLDALYHSAEGLGLAVPLSRAELRAALEATVAANHRTEGYARVIITRGPGTIGPDPRKIDPQVIVIAEQYHPFPRELYGHGLDAAVYPWPVDTASQLFHVRALGQPVIPLAKQHALQHGCLEAVLTTGSGLIAGATEGNLFIVKAGEVIVAAGQCPEATAAAVAAMAADKGLPIRVEAVPVEDLRGADEAFLAGTAAGIIGIIRIDGCNIGPGSEGPMTRALREAAGRLGIDT